MDFKNWPRTHSEKLPTPYEQVATHLEVELELNGLEAPDELKINTVSHNTANTKADKPKPMCQHCKKKQDITEISAVY